MKRIRKQSRRSQPTSNAFRPLSSAASLAATASSALLLSISTRFLSRSNASWVGASCLEPWPRRAGRGNITCYRAGHGAYRESSRSAFWTHHTHTQSIACLAFSLSPSLSLPLSLSLSLSLLEPLTHPTRLLHRREIACHADVVVPTVLPPGSSGACRREKSSFCYVQHTASSCCRRSLFRPHRWLQRRCDHLPLRACHSGFPVWLTMSTLSSVSIVGR